MPFHQVYTAGHGAGGRLGLNDEEPRSKFAGPLGTLEGVVVQQLTCGAKHSLVLSRQGRVYSWGYNQYGQTGHGPHGLSDWEPKIIKGIDKVKVVEVCAGEDHSLALTDTGDVYSWGHGLYGQLGHGDVRDLWYPFLVKSLMGKGIMSIGCGHNHSFAVTGAGKLYAFGSSSCGQLGNGETDGGMGGNVYLPALIKGLAAYKVIVARGGKNFSIFMTDKGDLLSVGYASNGQLGIAYDKVEELDESFTAVIRKVEHRGVSMAAVSCGEAHTVSVSDTGMVYSWGAGGNYCLGHGDDEDVFTPKLVTMLEAEVCLYASTGGCHTGVCTQTGRLYMWGRGFVGQLGMGHEVSRDADEFFESLPANVAWNDEACGAEVAIMVGAGFCHTVLITTLAGDEEELPPTPPVTIKQAQAVEEGETGPQKKKKAEVSGGPQTKEKKKRPLLTLVVTIVSARNIVAKDSRGTSDPYCKVKVKDGRNKDKERTKVLKETRDPVWNDKFVFKDCVNRIAVEGDPKLKEEGRMPDLNWDVRLKIACYDKDKLGKDEHLGVVFVPLAGMGVNRKRDFWVPFSPKIAGQEVTGDVRIQCILTDDPKAS